MGKLINFKITKGNIFDNMVIENLIKHNKKIKEKGGGKLFGDKGLYVKKK